MQSRAGRTDRQTDGVDSWVVHDGNPTAKGCRGDVCRANGGQASAGLQLPPGAIIPPGFCFQGFALECKVKSANDRATLWQPHGPLEGAKG